MDLSPLLTGQADLTTWALLIGGILIASKFAPSLLPLLKPLLGKLTNLSLPSLPAAASTDADPLESGMAICRSLVLRGKYEQAQQFMRDVMPGLLPDGTEPTQGQEG